MKEIVAHHAPKVMYVLKVTSVRETLTRRRSKEIQFGLLNAQDVVKLSEFQVTHRDLYTPVDRAPVKDGVLDRRLVRVCPQFGH